MKRFSLQRLTPPPVVANRNALIADSEQYSRMQNRFGARFYEGLEADENHLPWCLIEESVIPPSTAVVTAPIRKERSK